MYNTGHCALKHHAGNTEQIYFQNSFPRSVWPRDNFPFKIVAPVPFSVEHESLEEAGCRIVAEKLLQMTTQRNLFSFILKLLPQIRVHTSVFRILRSAKKQYEMNLIHKHSQELYKILLITRIPLKPPFFFLFRDLV